MFIATLVNDLGDFCTRKAYEQDREARRIAKQEEDLCRKKRHCPGYERLMNIRYNADKPKEKEHGL